MAIALTGIRPTGDLTVANYVGAMQPMVELQEAFDGTVNMFAADYHALTDQEPDVVVRTRLDTIRACMAAGIDPSQTNVYLQSQIGRATVELTALLDRHVTIAELMRVPTLKDKLRAGQEEKNATLALARYPVLMAADILIAEAVHVPVGADQIPHIEFTRQVARRFNGAYGKGEEVLAVPDLSVAEAVRIAALDGGPKMSKSQPNGALFLKDTPDAVKDKIRRAQTASPGEMTPVLDSHFLLAERLGATPEEKIALDALMQDHLNGARVMVKFKQFLTDITVRFLGGFQERLHSISDAEVKRALVRGGEQASAKAEEVMGRVNGALGFVSLEEFLRS